MNLSQDSVKNNLASTFGAGAVAIFSAFSTLADTGISSIKSKGMGDTSIAHEYGGAGGMTNPANAALYNNTDQVITFYLTGSNYDGDVNNENTLTNFSENTLNAYGFNVIFESGFSLGAYFAVSDYQTILQYRNSDEAIYATMGGDGYYASYTFKSFDSDWQHTIGASVSGFGYNVPDDFSNSSLQEGVFPTYGFKSSKEMQWHTNDQTLMVHVVFAGTHRRESTVLQNRNIEAITLLPSSTTLGSYLEFSHFNSTVPWQFGVSLEYELLSEPKSNFVSRLENIDSHMRVGAELSLFSLFGSETSLSLRGGMHQIVLANDETLLEPSIGLGYFVGSWNVELAANQQKYPAEATVVHASVTYQF